MAATAEIPVTRSPKKLTTSCSTGSLAEFSKRSASSPASSMAGSFKSGFGGSRPSSPTSFLSESGGFHRRPATVSGENTKGSYSLMCWRDTTDDIRIYPHRGLKGSYAPPSFQRAIMMPELRKSGLMYCS
eukprot:CAMPEP_0181475976 /NCGR_PEP_ID=MMETSP1110-20121109/41469_1 /TAXON_ID=174948 /ORGANISM="Symbiodinium sp., Strain CCMP421" /LENGTH=129 /DNA_ID=CAMNT_0023601245 /DNA_START=56 /DNA_END=445 /DNA_ORIENTATION=+